MSLLEPLGKPVMPTHRVVVVDDQPDNADMMAMLLAHWGHTVKVADSGPAALSLVQGFVPDVMFVDIGLPSMDGYELARRLRANPATASTLLVAVTGWGSLQDQRNSQEAGFDLHLTKPVAGTTIRAVLDRLAPPNASLCV